MPRKVRSGFVDEWTRVILGMEEVAQSEPSGTVEERPEPVDPAKGQTWIAMDDQRACRVMCSPVDGWVMARFKEAKPFVTHIDDWHKKFRRQQTSSATPSASTKTRSDTHAQD